MVLYTGVEESIVLTDEGRSIRDSGDAQRLQNHFRLQR
jgi:hypothetical protein